MLEFLAHVRTRPASRGRGGPGSRCRAAAVARLVTGDIEQFYAHMAGSAKTTRPPPWGRARLARAGTRSTKGSTGAASFPVADRPPLEGQGHQRGYAMAQIMGRRLLGTSTAEGGNGGEQAMRG